jgi:hypothetical protein
METISIMQTTEETDGAQLKEIVQAALSQIDEIGRSMKQVGMTIQVRVLGTHWVRRQIPDPSGMDMRTIFYPRVTSVSDPNRDGYGRVFFSICG